MKFRDGWMYQISGKLFPAGKFEVKEVKDNFVAGTPLSIQR